MPIESQQGWLAYGQSVLLVILATLLGQPIHVYIEPTNLVMLYLLVVVVVAVRLGRGPAVVAAMLSVLAFDVFFVPPRLALGVEDAQYLLTFAGLLVVGLVISALAAHANQQAQAAGRREAQAIASYKLNRDLVVAAEIDAIVRVVITHVTELFHGEAGILLVGDNTPTLRATNPAFQLCTSEQAVVAWSFRHRQIVGPGSNPFRATQNYHFPLQTAQDILGVLVFRPHAATRRLNAEQHRLLESFASQAALALERARLAEQARETKLLQETEKLQAALLNSISHDLRTPLATITGTLSGLLDYSAKLDEATRHELTESALAEAERLNQLVANLLDMTRLEAGAVQVRREPCDVMDVVGVALTRLAHRIQEREINIEIAPYLPLVPMDFVLMVQVIVNLLDNALKYSPPGTLVDVCARIHQDTLQLSVADQGFGIPTGELERIFEKFYRISRGDDGAGTGLGLSISKGIVEAHGGRIWAKPRTPQGTVVTVTLPLEVTPQGA